MHLSISVMLHNIARVRGPVEALNEVDEEEDSSDSHTICEGSVGRDREARLGPRGYRGRRRKHALIARKCLGHRRFR
jgi:hypothetical protein